MTTAFIVHGIRVLLAGQLVIRYGLKSRDEDISSKFHKSFLLKGSRKDFCVWTVWEWNTNTVRFEVDFSQQRDYIHKQRLLADFLT